MAVGSLGQLTVDLVANTAGFERGMNQAERALASATKEAKYQGDQLERLIGKIDPTVAAYARLDKMEQQLEAHRKAGRLPTEDYVEYIAKINASREAISKNDAVIAKSGVSARQTAAAFGMLPAQLSDIAVQLAGGQNPFLILLQQGSQIKDSFGGIGPTFDAFGAKIKGLFTGGSGLADLAAGTLAVGDSAEAAGEGLGSLAEGANTAADASKNASEAAGALKTATEGVGLSAGVVVGIVVAAAAAIAALVVAYKQGSDEATAYNTALALTGNTAGTSVGELGRLAKAVSEVQGTVHDAAATLALLAGSTQIPVESFETIAVAAANLEDATGKAAKETVAEFAKLAGDPVRAVLKLNESLNFLTVETYNQIKALQESGKVQEAGVVATNAYADAINSRTPKITENLGFIERAWKNLGDAANTAIDTARGIGRADAGPDLTALQQRLAYQTSLIGTEGEGSDTKGKIADLTKQIAAIQALTKAQQDSARAEGEQQQAQQRSIVDQVALEKLRAETQTNEQKRIKELGDYRKLVDRRRVQAEKLNNKDLLISAEQQAKDIANIENKYKDPVKPKGPAYSEDAGLRMLDSLRQQNAALQLQSETNEKLGVQAKALAAFEQQIADIKTKSVLTADQKSLLASEDLITAQLKRNVALEQEVAARKNAYEEAGKLAAFELNQQSKLAEARDANNARLEGLGQGSKLRERLQEELAIRKEYQNEQDKLEAQRSKGQIGKSRYDEETTILEEALATRLVDQQDYYNQVDAASGSFFLGASEAWANWATEAQDYSAQGAEAVTTVLNDATSSVASGLDGIIRGTETVGQAFANLGVSMASSILGALEQIAAKWIVTETLQLLGISTVTGATLASEATKTGAVVSAEATKTAAKLAADATTTASSLAGIATTLAANLSAAASTLASWLPAALVASIGSFGAAAVVGGAALVAAYALLGGFSEGGYTGSGGKYETAGVVHKGEVVWSQADIRRAGGVSTVEAMRKGALASQEPLLMGVPVGVANSARVDNTLSGVKSSAGTGNTTVNLIEDASRAGQTETREEDGQKFIDLWIAKLYADDDVMDALNRKTGLRGVGQ